MFIWINGKVSNLWLCNKYSRITSKFRFLGLNIPKWSRYRKFSRFDSVRTINCVSILFDAALINISSSLKNPCFFCWGIWLVISRYCMNLLSQLCAENSPTVSNICNIANLVNYKEDKCTATSSFYWFFALSNSEELRFSIFEPFLQGLDGFMWEKFILGNLKY